MPEPESERHETDSGIPGVGGMAAGIVATLIDYLHARVALLGLEAREARREFLIRTICGVAGAFFLLVAWLATVTGAIGWLANERGWPWPMVALAVAAIHLLVGLALLLAARRRFAEPPFRDSLNELEKDRQWLKRQRPGR